MLIKFTRVCAPLNQTGRAIAGYNPSMTGEEGKKQEANKYQLEEISVSNEHVLYLSKKRLDETRFPEGLKAAHEFTSIWFSSAPKTLEIVVVGNLKTVSEKLKSKQLLKG